MSIALPSKQGRVAIIISTSGSMCFCLLFAIYHDNIFRIRLEYCVCLVQNWMQVWVRWRNMREKSIFDSKFVLWGIKRSPLAQKKTHSNGAEDTCTERACICRDLYYTFFLNHKMRESFSIRKLWNYSIG